MKRPRVIDWYCKAGGTSWGLHLAGFEVWGIDKDPQPRYPFKFIQADALALLADPPGWVREADAHVGGPKCQAHTLAQRIRGNEHEDQIPATRVGFRALGKPYVIENVEGAPLIDPVMLCGAMFPELGVYRHRLFEASFPLLQPEHPAHVAPLRKMGRAPQPGDFMHVVGNFSGVAQARKAMGIDWMVRDELREAIPPTFTRLVGEQLLAHIRAEVPA